ncbi:hypothetical protein ABZT28_00430 [Streptomyces sp. NPDC005388]
MSGAASTRRIDEGRFVLDPGPGTGTDTGRGDRARRRPPGT